MFLRFYIKAMFIVAIPISIFGYYLTVLSTHVEGVFLLVGKIIFPAFFLEEYFVHAGIGLYWFLMISLQLIYSTVLIYLYYTFFKNNRKSGQ